MRIDVEDLRRKAEAEAAGAKPNGHDPDGSPDDSDGGVDYDAILQATHAWVAQQPADPSLTAISDWIAWLFTDSDPFVLRDPVVDILIGHWGKAKLSLNTARALWDEVAGAAKANARAEAAATKQRAAAAEPDNDERPLVVEELEPWPDPVDGFEVSAEVCEQYRRSVVLPSPAHTDLMTLHTIGTYLMDCWTLWPKLAIFSPTRECGKTRLMEVYEALSCRALLASNITSASLFRVIEAHHPTIILDEADRFMKEKPELVGIMNAGHTRRTARVLRSVPTADGGYEVQVMSTWAARILGGIGTDWLDHALRSRCVEVRLERKDTGTPVQRLGSRYFEEQAGIRSRLLRWANDVAIAVRSDTSEPPNLGNDRRQDNWTPLLRVANALGGNWPARCLAAYQAMSRDGDDDGSELQLLMLGDLHMMMRERKSPMMDSAEIVRELNKLDSSPWQEARGGRGISTHGVARLLKPFGIKPTRYRDGVRAPMRGYAKADIERVAARYLPAEDPDLRGVSS